VFHNGNDFGITRSPNPHVGFGSAGPDFCLGAYLARREISAMLRGCWSGSPGIRAAGEPDRLLSSFINGIKHLTCEFGWPTPCSDGPRGRRGRRQGQPAP
jgi:methyl-branched lipid omega-hydroxylase